MKEHQFIDIEEVASEKHIHSDGAKPDEDFGDDDFGAKKDQHRDDQHRDGNGGGRDEPPPPDSPDDYGSERTTGTSSKPRFVPVWIDDIVLSDDPPWLIEGLLPAGPSLSVVFGPPKSLKSFALMDAFLHVAMGRSYGGRPVQQGATIYVTSEGVTGVTRRLIAMRRHHGIEGERVPFALIPVMPNLGTGTDDLAKLIHDIETITAELDVPVRAIGIDTLRRAMPGKSENDVKDISMLVTNCDALARHFSAHVALVHHSPRSDDTRSSGSNAVDAAADAMWSVVRQPGATSATISVATLKDGEEGDTWEFELCPTAVGTDREGMSVSACYVEITSPPVMTKPRSEKPPTVSAAQRRFLDIVEKAVAEAGAPLKDSSFGPSMSASIRAVTRELLKTYCKTEGWWDADDHGARSRFSARLNELAGKKLVGLTATHVWLVPKNRRGASL